jgi:hypothetical protein
MTSVAGLPLAAHVVADGPAYYFGGSIMSFALPLGAFIVIAIVLFFLFRARHSGPRLKYLATSGVASLTTREPGPAPAPSVAADEVKPEPKAEPKDEAEAEPTTGSKDGGE